MILNNTQIAGTITEQKCFLKCLEMGFQVSKPLFDNARYDFILDTGENLFRIQVKTSHWKNDEHTAFCFNCYSQHSTGNGTKVMKYTNKEIDFFMTEKEGVFYLYPAPITGIKEKTLRTCPPKSGQIKGIDFCKDFIFENIIGTNDYEFKTVCPNGRMGSNPILTALKVLTATYKKIKNYKLY